MNSSDSKAEKTSEGNRNGFRCSEKTNRGALTLVISTGDAVLHFAVETGVFIACSEGPHPRARLALRYLKGTLVLSGEGWRHVVHVQDVYRHLEAGRRQIFIQTPTKQELVMGIWIIYYGG